MSVAVRAASARKLERAFELIALATMLAACAASVGPSPEQELAHQDAPYEATVAAVAPRRAHLDAPLGISRANAPAAPLSWSASRQLVLVTTPDWNASHGTLRRYERNGSDWVAVGASAPVAIGRAGSAWGLGLHPAQRDGPVKREGDGRAPAGVFLLGDAFGYAEHADTAMPYAAMQDSDFCIDVSGSPLYNRIVDTRDVGEGAIAGSTEPMRRDLHADGDPRYRLGLVIRHNDAGIADAGSCIFVHLWRTPGQATAGCTAMDEAAMQALFAWLRPEHAPVFVLLPAPELARLQRDWQLPSAE